MGTREVTIYHSPDADDAFMFYGIVSGNVTVPDYKINSELADIETLNQRAIKGELDITAVSVHAYSYLADRYAILTHGASMGEKNYGPKLISKTMQSPITAWRSRQLRLALPGTLTSATLAIKLYLQEQGIEADLRQMHFDEIESAVLTGEVDAGLLIHEGQITCREKGLNVVLDLGQWWWEKTELPLPLGINIIKKDLPFHDKQAAAAGLLHSIEYGMKHRREALAYALSYGRGLSEADADEFIGMYVNHRTLELGEEGKRAIWLFLQSGAEAGLCPNVSKIEFIEANS